jgi:DNA-3-methyladenine glycosylase
LRDNEKNLTSSKSDLWIADDGSPRTRVKITSRIGITKAAELPLRYIIPGNRFVSGRRDFTVPLPVKAFNRKDR